MGPRFKRETLSCSLSLLMLLPLKSTRAGSTDHGPSDHPTESSEGFALHPRESIRRVILSAWGV